MVKSLLYSMEEFRNVANAFPLSNLGLLRNQICRFWCEYPEWVLAGAGLSVVASSGGAVPAASITLGSLATLCSGRCTAAPNKGFNPRKQPGIVRGQCSVPYTFTGEAFYRASADGYTASVLFSAAPGTAFRGPFSLVSGSPLANFGSVNAGGFNLNLNCFTNPGGSATTYTGGAAGTNPAGGISGHGNSFFLQWYQITFTRVDGLPDTCGNGPVTYPSPPSSLYTYNTNIAINNNINLNLWPQPFNFPVTLSPVFNNVFMPLFINFGGQRLYFDVDGLYEFRPSITVNLPDLAPPDVDTLPPVLTPVNPPSGTPPEDFPPSQEYPPPEEPGEGGGCTVVTTQNWDYLQVLVNTSGYDGDYVFDDDGGSLVVFAGYVRWTIGGIPSGLEMPIRRTTQLFRFPIGVDGYLLSPLHGCTLTASVVSIEEDLQKVQYECEET